MFPVRPLIGAAMTGNEGTATNALQRIKTGKAMRHSAWWVATTDTPNWVSWTPNVLLLVPLVSQDAPSSRRHIHLA